MIIHNASFIMERDAEADFLAWLRSCCEKINWEHEPGAPTALRVSAMREAGGVDYRQAEAQTVAFQLEFHTIEDAKKWSAQRFSSIAAEFEEKFGPQAMVFVSLFESLELI